MGVTKPYKFIGFGAMDVTKPYKCIGFGAAPYTGGLGPDKGPIGHATSTMSGPPKNITLSHLVAP